MSAAGLATDRPARPLATEHVRVHAPGRLHLGFLDPGASLGRAFGSLGVAVGGPETVVELGRGESDSFETCAGGDGALQRAREHLAALRRATGCDAPVRLRLRSVLPAHAGLGSGTQLALAVGRAFCATFGVDLDGRHLAGLLHRGVRSGAGIASFEQGGLSVDGGPRADGSPAPLLARIALPPAWRVLLVLDPRMRGLSGAAEKEALAGLAPLPRAAAADVCHQVLMRVLPGAAGAEFAPFAAGVSRIQEVLGAHFAPAQGGCAFASEPAGRLLRWVAQDTTAGIGQSSWGPAAFAFLASEAQARDVLQRARAAGVVDPALAVLVVPARNHGAWTTVARAGG
ncbi:beta-ribofuranosylaminobenzene 5'-phosphate synthase [Ramlibacter sp. USB13]|uniref:Beta-ribofuranosylaminobenzene 5'-phosphate synthase n=1 Tax=Ramlibacter cellulosilyticus TaxID=2764187 RepID=A0A923MP19_9BURK|nr:beta-ribofuranosylaminobenzene 5'-phosphate synthase family protein [Ramlibacter cellulosilyticus]MBC5782223.1 beta-ribofuranosylaminobenzene 5'-phosphate synthase [Ramlibacter cellulosilyticus]